MKKHFNGQDIAIDLTSLLDVIFIVLLIVMCGQQLEAKDAREEAAQAAEMAEEASRMAEAYADHARKYEETDEYVLFVDVTAAYSTAQISERTIRVMAGAGAEGAQPYVIGITPQSASAGFQELEDYLNSKIGEYASREEGGRPVILTLNKKDEDILYRDEKEIKEIFDRLVEKYDDIYLR